MMRPSLMATHLPAWRSVFATRSGGSWRRSDVRRFQRASQYGALDLAILSLGDGIHGHDPESGYYDVRSRTVFVLVKRGDGWRLYSQEELGYE